MEKIAETHTKLCKQQLEQDQGKLDTVLGSMEPMKRCAIMRAVDEKTSNSLTVMPVTRHHCDLQWHFVIP